MKKLTLALFTIIFFLLACSDNKTQTSDNLNWTTDLGKAIETAKAENKAVLVCGPGELSSKTIKSTNNAGDWVYHLKDTTLYTVIRPAHDDTTHVRFATAGRNERDILSDLQNILEYYDYSERKKYDKTGSL